MDFSALRSSGITKSTNRQGRRPGKSACTACHIRKKRCDAAPPYYQCTFCRNEDQLCIPRDPIERPGRHRIQNRNTNTKNSRSSCTIIDQSHQEKDISLPPGIDHEIPRWSAMYSIYSEMQRLLPSPSLSPEIKEENPPEMRSDAEENEQETEAPVPEVESAKQHPSGWSKRGCADKGRIQGIKKSTSQTSSASPPSRGKVSLSQASNAADSMHSNTSSMARVETDGDIGSAHHVFMNDLDALLRF